MSSDLFETLAILNTFLIYEVNFLYMASSWSIDRPMLSWRQSVLIDIDVVMNTFTNNDLR